MVKDGQIVAIIDWEAVGWYPEYWVHIFEDFSWALWRDVVDRFHAIYISSSI
jgi:hypothetical protein